MWYLPGGPACRHGPFRAARAPFDHAERPGVFLVTVQEGKTLIGTISAVFAGGSLTGGLGNDLVHR